MSADRPQEPDSLPHDAEVVRDSICDLISYYTDTATKKVVVPVESIHRLLNEFDDLLRATCQERDTLRRAARELWAALVIEWNSTNEDPGHTEVAAVMRRWKGLVGADDAAAVLREVPANPDGDS